MSKRTTKEIGDQLEKYILKILKQEEPENLKIKRTKGSGNQRGDGDIKILSNDKYHTPLLLIDGKNSDRDKGTVPSKKDVDKHDTEAVKHHALYGGIVVRSGKDNKKYAACEWTTMLALIRAMIRVEDNFDR